MGTVLLSVASVRVHDSASASFSPLLDGDGVASLVTARNVSAAARGFSPLLDGDGVASRSDAACDGNCSFQSPSRWGRCCISRHSGWTIGTDFAFQSPSRWGRCCIFRRAMLPQACHRRFSPLLDGDGVASARGCGMLHVASSVSVPFSMGTVLHHRSQARRRSRNLLVSVPFSMGTVLLSSTAPAR